MKTIIAACFAALCSNLVLAQPLTVDHVPQTPPNSVQSVSDDSDKLKQKSASTAKVESTVPPAPNRFDALGVKGWDSPFPTVSDSLIGDKWGLRSKLAEYGIGFMGYSINSMTYNLRHDNTPGAKYNGRRPTYYMGGQGLFVTYDLGRVGLEDGQLQVLLDANTNNANDLNPPKTINIGTLAYYQSYDKGKYETKLGYMVMSQEFIGANVAGSFANGTLGPSAALVGQTGVAFPGLSTPGATFRYNGPNYFYDKIAVGRAIPNQEYDKTFDDIEFGLRFSFPDTKPFVINEIGYNRPAGPGQKSLWVRGGGIYNKTQYANFETGGTSSNKGAYIGADYQVSQKDGGLPFQGVYVGASFTYAPPETNLYSRYYEARVYGIGVVPGRPFDMASVVGTWNSISKSGLDVAFAGQDAADYSASITGSYAYQVVPGAYIQVGLGLVKNVELAPEVPLAFQSYLSLNLLF